MAFTYFFRDLHTLKLIEQHVIPQLATRRYLDIWDAGCADGPEPYTLAMMLSENMGKFLFRNVRIHATDLNGRFGETISNGVYPQEQVKRIPSEVFERYFDPVGNGDFVLKEAIRKAVRFQEHDLTSLQPVRDGFGLIVCKNVLLHLSHDDRVAVLRMFHNSLSPGGYLATEQTQKMPVEVQGLFSQLVPDGQVYQRIG